MIFYHDDDLKLEKDSNVIFAKWGGDLEILVDDCELAPTTVKKGGKSKHGAGTLDPPTSILHKVAAANTSTQSLGYLKPVARKLSGVTRGASPSQIKFSNVKKKKKQKKNIKQSMLVFMHWREWDAM